MTLSGRMVEAAAIARATEDGKSDWNALMDHEQARYRVEATTALTAALAVAEGEGVVLTRVPERLMPLDTDHMIYSLACAKADGHNACRAATLAGRVTL